MPREHLFLDGEEDTIHANEIVPKTPKEKRANWWFYHKVHVIVGVLLVALAGGTVTGRVAVLAEGDAADRKDIIFLEKLPTFPHD